MELVKIFRFKWEFLHRVSVYMLKYVFCWHILLEYEFKRCADLSPRSNASGIIHWAVRQLLAAKKKTLRQGHCNTAPCLASRNKTYEKTCRGFWMHKSGHEINSILFSMGTTVLGEKSYHKYTVYVLTCLSRWALINFSTEYLLMLTKFSFISYCHCR